MHDSHAGSRCPGPLGGSERPGPGPLGAVASPHVEQLLQGGFATMPGNMDDALLLDVLPGWPPVICLSQIMTLILVSGIPSRCPGGCMQSNVRYWPPNPPQGMHRYIFLLYEQTGGKDLNMTQQGQPVRKEWDIKGGVLPLMELPCSGHPECPPGGGDDECLLTMFSDQLMCLCNAA